RCRRTTASVTSRASASCRISWHATRARLSRRWCAVRGHTPTPDAATFCCGGKRIGAPHCGTTCVRCPFGLPTGPPGAPCCARPTPPVVRSLLRTVREVAPDVLHSHGYKANILLGPLPRRLRGPMIATLHGWTAARTFSALWLYERLDRLSLRRIDSVVVVARCMLQLAALRGVAPARQRVIENGIPPRDVRLADLAARGVAPLAGELVGFTSSGSAR